MKKILLYSAVAVALGLLLTLGPLFTVAGFKAEISYGRLLSLPERMKSLEGRVYNLDAPKYSVVDIEVLAISFVAALVAYVLFKFRIPH
ncbi:MAG: hypothetical protein OEY95_03300 [Candidatus Bathyarchaeota archaeon]|nr:hypothetical protein [Candidatus Bathyarchaeota archaeon]